MQATYVTSVSELYWDCLWLSTMQHLKQLVVQQMCISPLLLFYVTVIMIQVISLLMSVPGL